MSEAYVYSGSDKLSIESVNAAAAATFVVYPDGNLTDEEFQLFAESETLDRELKKAYKELNIARQR